MLLRKHQLETAEIFAGIVQGSPIKNVVADVCTGGGKSLLPVIAAASLIPAGLASKIAWICPRTSLQDQGERAFLDHRVRQALGHDLVIRSATNDADCSRGTNGIITTYQALAVDREKTVLRDFMRYPYILVCDEYHHLSEQGEWTAPVQELYEHARYRLMLTGTLSRGDKARVAFTPYTQVAARRWAPCFENDQESVIIRYSRKDALAEKAIIPLEFHLMDGVARWRKESGKEVEAKLSTSRHDANQALFTALKTGYAEEMLSNGIAHWQNHSRTINPNGSVMVVAANIESAKEYTAILKRMGLRAEIATSDDTPQALHHIKALRHGSLRILVAVAMVSEGLDIPSISHIIALTNIRTPEWIIQMCGRAVRIDPQAGPYETQKGYIFAPADQLFQQLAADIEADQHEYIAKVLDNTAPTNGGSGEGNGTPGITPLSSRLINGQGNLFGWPSTPPAALQPIKFPVKTQREIERELRDEIDRHVKRFCRLYNCRIATLNRELKELYGKPREQMTVKELESLKSYVNYQYAIPEQREIIHTISQWW